MSGEVSDCREVGGMSLPVRATWELPHRPFTWFHREIADAGLAPPN
jgi:hypothetical protein